MNPTTRRHPHLSTKQLQPDRRQIQLEDEKLYGPPSPRPQSRNSNNPPHSSTSHSFSPITPDDPNQWSNSQDIANPSTDELFLSESYPPIHSQLHLPFFNEKLPSPIGMGRGHPIISPSPYTNSSSPPYGSIERIWKRITRILIEKPYQLPELADTLSYPASELSINSLSRLLEPYQLALPNVIRDHFLTHDGQDVFTLNSSRSSGSAPLGIVWGLWLMSCEEVEAEWGFWRRFDGGLMPGDAFAATDFSSSQYQQQQQTSHFPPTRVDQGMSSCPAGWVREVYSHPAWLPLLSDRVGNYIGIDLSPPPSSSYSTPKIPSSSSPSSTPDCRRIGGGQGNARPESGQVIAFGREIDEKVVLWRGEGRDGWANWLASFADDLEDGNFARLIGKKSKPSLKNRLKSRRNSDGERGWNHSEDDSEDTEDGLGDLSYFNEGAGFGGGASEDGDFYGWRLAPEYRGMSVIEALCARSKQRWAEVGSYSSRHNPIRSESRSHSQSGASKQSPHISTGQQQAGPSGSTDQTEESGRQEDSHPPTPIAYVTPPSPRPLGVEFKEPEAQPSGSTSSVVAGPSSTGEAKKAEGGLQPVPSERGHSQRLQQAPPRRRRLPPPAPVSLDLPTMDTLLLDAVVHPTGPSRKSSTSSVGSGSPNPNNDSSGSTPKLISKLSLVTQRISEEMGRRTSPVHASPLPSNSVPNHSATATTTTHHHHPDDKEAIGMVILDHHSHPPTLQPQPEKPFPDHHHSHFTNHNPPPAPPSASQGLGIIRTES